MNQCPECGETEGRHQPWCPADLIARRLPGKRDWPAIIGGIVIAIVVIFIVANIMTKCSGMLRSMP
jgi:uncharacterized membrane protein YcfT